jgi:hypothetical protein
MIPQIDEHLLSQQLDIRATGNGRWIDQKVTPDVVAFISDCILNLPKSVLDGQFTKNNIWFSAYFETNMPIYFSKPDVSEESARSEYDKVCSQPLKMLAAAGILSEEKIIGTNHYSLERREILEWISLSTGNAFQFLIRYIEQSLEKSGFWHNFEAYTSSGHSREDMRLLQGKFQQFILAHTRIRGTTEINRIFPKVINPLCCARGIPGIIRGFASKNQIMFSELMYNRVNWRDLRKDKRKTRSTQATSEPTESFREYEMRKVKGAVRTRHFPMSELQDAWSAGEATQVHHIFPVSTFPGLACTPENLILLTATQHNSKAHPQNNTQLVDKNYQIDCLVAKIKSIERSENADGFYSKDEFQRVLAIGLGLIGDEDRETLIARLQSFRN